MDHLNSDKCNWPMLLDMTMEECKQNLRALELSTYSKIVSVLRAQGELTKEKRKLLSELQSLFSIPLERHRAEIRRAVNDEILHTVAERLAGPNTGAEWAIEGRRLIPLMPRVAPQVAYTALATHMAQIYCGLNANNLKPSETSVYGKFEDICADDDLTDSEEETEGLRFIPDAMVPQQYVADQGSYTTLPQSQARIALERLKEKENEILENVKSNDEDTTSSDEPPSMPSSPTPVSSPGPHLVVAQKYIGATTQGSLVGAEKRKRKRSISTDHVPPHPPPPPPAIISPEVTQASALLAKPLPQNVNAPVRQHPNLGSALSSSSLKITVTGGITRSTTLPITSLSSHTPKVILVSTSAASGQSVNVYQRSISVPILKQNTPGSFIGGPLIASNVGGGHPVNPNAVLRGPCPSLAASPSTVLCSSSPFVSKIRPRFASMSSSILSQGSSSLPGLPPRPPPRQRSNSLILQNDNPSTSGEVIISKPVNASSIIGHTVYPDSPSGGSLNILGPLQLRSGVTALGPKNSIHMKQEANKMPVIAQSIVPSSGVGSSISNVVGGRVIGRTSSSSQGLYVVSTSSGTITVVTRTVASGSVTSPRVVTVNTINNSRPSIVRGPAPTTIVSVGMNQKSIPVRQTAGIRPVITGPRSNVIVVHKGAMSAGTRPVGVQGLRDISAKIITKPLTSCLPSTSNIPSGLLSGTLVVKPTTMGKAAACVASNKKDNNSVTNNMICSSSISQSAEISAVNSNVIVLDFSHSGATTGSQSSSTTLANLFHSSRCGNSSNSLNNTGIMRNEEAIESINHFRRDTLISGAMSHEISAVSASSSLPATRCIKPPNIIQERPSPSNTEAVEIADEVTSADFSLSSHMTTGSPSNIHRQDIDFMDLPEGSEGINPSQVHKPISSSLSSIERDVENEWLKLLEGDEMAEDKEKNDDQHEFDDEEKSNLMTEESADNDTDLEGSTSKTYIEEEIERVTEEDLHKELHDRENSSSVMEDLTEGNQNLSCVKDDYMCEAKNISSSSNKEVNLQMLVETAVDVLNGNSFTESRDHSSDDTFQIFESNLSHEQSNEESYCVTSIVSSKEGGLSSSSMVLCPEGQSQSPSTPLRDESSLGGFTELDPTTGYFCSSFIEENSSEIPASVKTDSITDEEESTLQRIASEK